MMTRPSQPTPSPSLRTVAASTSETAGDSANIGIMLTPMSSAASHDDVDVLSAVPVRIADIGCGTGLMVDQLQYRLSAEGQAVKLDRKLQIDGLDCSAAMLDHMPKHRRKVYNKLVCKRFDVDETLLTNISQDPTASGETVGEQTAIEIAPLQNDNVSGLDLGQFFLLIFRNVMVRTEV